MDFLYLVISYILAYYSKAKAKTFIFLHSVIKTVVSPPKRTYSARFNIT
jgi:hypothetical protein